MIRPLYGPFLTGNSRSADPYLVSSTKTMSSSVSGQSVATPSTMPPYISTTTLIFFFIFASSQSVRPLRFGFFPCLAAILFGTGQVNRVRRVFLVDVAPGHHPQLAAPVLDQHGSAVAVLRRMVPESLEPQDEVLAVPLKLDSAPNRLGFGFGVVLKLELEGLVHHRLVNPLHFGWHHFQHFRSLHSVSATLFPERPA